MEIRAIVHVGKNEGRCNCCKVEMSRLSLIEWCDSVCCDGLVSEVKERPR